MKWLCALLLAGCESVFPLDSPPPAWRLLGFGQVESVDTLPLGTPTSAHSLVVVAVQTDGFVRVTEVTDNAGNVYQQAPAAEVTRTTDTSETTVSVWFAADPAPGATNVTTSAGLFAEGMVGWQVETVRAARPSIASCAGWS